MRFRIPRTALAVAVAVLLSGCAIIPEKVSIDYVPDGPVTPVAGARGQMQRPPLTGCQRATDSVFG